MRLSKEWVISSRMKFSLKLIAKYSKIFFFIFLPLESLIIIFADSLVEFFFGSIFVLLISIFILNYFNKKRDSELAEIKRIISKIHNKDFKDQNEIKLNPDLITLENEIKMMFEKNQNDMNALRKLERMRREFLANVSHELRTPVFAIQGFVETLLNGAIKDDKVNMKFLEKANSHTVSLSNLVNDLIEISMIESGELRMSFRFFQVKNELEIIMSEMQPIAEKKGLKLTLLPFRDELKVLGDKNRLKQVFNNLLGNAIKYTEKGEITISVIEEDNSVLFKISDTGIGIPEEDLNRIFERFYMVDKARSKEMGGTGLGLSIVKHIIEAHGSKIEVKSQIGKGSEFYFRLKK